MTYNPEQPLEMRPTEIATLQPFDHQQAVIDDIRTARENGERSGYINVATGCGKTVIAAHEVADFKRENPDSRILYLCHKTEILEQASDTFSDVLKTGSHGRVFGGQYEDQEDIVFATFQAMNRKLGGGKVYEAFDKEEFDYIVVDEGHHGPAETYREVIEHFTPQFRLGLTATPDRRDRQDISEIFGPELHTILLEEAIAKGHVAKLDYRVLSDNISDIESLTTKAGPISIKELNRKVFVRKRDSEIAEEIFDHTSKMENPRMIVFCPTIEYAERMADFMPGKTVTYHSKLQPDEQKARLNDFRSGEATTILAIDKLNEGVDVPEANVVVFLRSTESRTVFLQQLGRGARKTEGKDNLLVLDFVASWERIQDIQALKSGVYRANGLHNKPAIHADTNFKFTFSEEALKAIEVIEFMRNERANRPKSLANLRRNRSEGSRKENWDRIDESIKEMLSVDTLPNQRLSKAEWNRYEQRLLNGDPTAVNELSQGCLRHAYKAAERINAEMGEYALPIEDTFQSMMEKVLATIQEYGKNNSSVSLKDQLGFKVIARPYDALKSSLIVKPAAVTKDLLDIKKAEETLAMKHGSNYTLDMLSEILGMEPSKILKRVSYDQRVADKNMIDISKIADNLRGRFARSLEDLYEEFVSDKEAVRSALDNLSYRERRVLELWYGLGKQPDKSLDEIGRTFNVTRERVRQIIAAGQKKLNENGELEAGVLVDNEWIERVKVYNSRKKIYRDREIAYQTQRYRDRRATEVMLIGEEDVKNLDAVNKAAAMAPRISALVMQHLVNAYWKDQEKLSRRSHSIRDLGFYVSRTLDRKIKLSNNEIIAAVNSLEADGSLIKERVINVTQEDVGRTVNITHRIVPAIQGQLFNPDLYDQNAEKSREARVQEFLANLPISD